MRRHHWLSWIFSCLVCLSVAGGVGGQTLPAPATQAVDPAGVWNGEIRIGPQTVVVEIELTRPATVDAPWTGTFAQPQQTLRGMALEKIVIEEGRVVFAIRGVPGSPTFVGSVAGDEMKGVFTQGGGRGIFLLKRGKFEVRPRPQEPTGQLPYKVEDVSIPVKEGVVLSGTLTLPEGRAEGGAAGVVLVTGSGPQNRDEELMGHRPFLVLADRLTRAGIAVLRYDDRGVGKSTGSFVAATTDDFADDAAAAARFLAARPEVHAAAVGIIGHSEGGLVAPMVASRDNSPVGFIVLLAGPGVTGAEVLKHQFSAITLASGMNPDWVKKMAAVQDRVIDHASAGNREAALDAMVELLALQRGLVNVTEEGKSMIRTEAEPQMNNMFAPWYQRFLKTDPRPFLSQVKVPVLALNGDLDRQVDPDQNLPEIEKALKAGGNTHVTLKRFPGLNHLFQTTTTGAPSEYAKLDETFNEAVIETIIEWIRGNAPKP